MSQIVTKYNKGVLVGLSPSTSISTVICLPGAAQNPGVIDTVSLTGGFQQPATHTLFKLLQLRTSLSEGLPPLSIYSCLSPEAHEVPKLWNSLMFDLRPAPPEQFSGRGETFSFWDSIFAVIRSVGECFLRLKILLPLCGGLAWCWL